MCTGRKRRKPDCAILKSQRQAQTAPDVVSTLRSLFQALLTPLIINTVSDPVMKPNVMNKGPTKSDLVRCSVNKSPILIKLYAVQVVSMTNDLFNSYKKIGLLAIRYSLTLSGSVCNRWGEMRKRAVRILPNRLQPDYPFPYT